ncbi:hypothetical protein OG792_17865 [Micromonospora sp. NBC_01699]|uniref:hypothetical protein n=1 Tax=Micromonospora sp. NBC_01699 TaxID=2975984 RepID=UPI002E2EBEFF|nr:hypothetical protein [Micromonospora sp. NBC_01699]
MSFLSEARHRLGLHTGEWTYDAEKRCDQTFSCTGCASVRTRTRHSFDEWHRRTPCDEATCGMVRTCRVCREVTFRPEHEFTWHYFSALPDLPDFPAKSKLGRVMFQGPCKQFSLCDHCGRLENTNYRVWHDMGPSMVGGTEHVDIGPGGFDSPVYYQACKVCDKRIRSAG